MSDEEHNDGRAIDQTHSSIATSACYVFTPTNENQHERAKKRRKVSKSLKKKNSGLEFPQFVSLLDGHEKDIFAHNRREKLEIAWTELDRVFVSVLEDVNSSTVDSIVHFIANTRASQSQIPTCLVTAGLTGTAYGSIIDAVASRTIESQLMIKLTPSLCTNLKSALKNIIHAGTNSVDSDDEALPVARQGARLLNYDLRILHEHMKQHAISKILLSFQNSESFDGTVLAEIIDIFRAWSDRISTIFIFDITISIENFQEKLPRATLRHLQGIVFESTDAEETLDLLFRAITSPNVHGQLRIGSALMKTIIDRQLEHIQSGHAFIQAVKYAYIIHYFTNPLSILTDRNDSAGALQREHYEVIRDLPSFRRCTQKMVDSKELDKVQSLLDDDEILDKFTTTLIDHGQKSLRGILCALDVASKIQSCIPEKLSLRWSELYIKGLSANLANSNFIRDLLLSVRKFPSDTMHTLLEALSQTPNLATAIRPIQTALRTLTAAHPSSTTAPLRSEHDLRHHETLRTTIVAQKVSLSKHKATLSKQDAAYSQLVARVDTALRTYFNEYLIDPKDLVFHEIFIHDARASCRDVFMPAPRRAIERALSAPHDYLNCECCEGGGKGDAAALSSSQPATAILYQLYLESGALINIADLWAAFSAVVGTEGEEEKGEAEKKDDDDDDEERKLALFYRALAELKYLGMIKNSRKRTDHLTKLAWKGL